MTSPLIAIVGRPNVGKSTLYNRLVGGRPALVHDTPGLTRDRRYGEFDYFGHDFRVVDTGGLDPAAEKDVIGAGIHRQAHTAIEQSDAVLFVVDATAGVTALDREIQAMLRKLGQTGQGGKGGKAGKPLLVCANKVDHLKREALVPELYELGMGEIYPVSAAHGRGVDELLDALIERLELPPPAAEGERDSEPGARAGARTSAKTGTSARTRTGASAERDAGEPEQREGGVERDTSQPLRVAFVGKPNAGKSSLLNRLVGVERALVHHEPGTTTDPVDTSFEFGGRSYVLVDTAGIRRKARIDEATEKIAVSLALDQIRRADVVVLVIDGHEGPSEQDARLAGSIEQSGRAVVIALNKTDLLGGPGAGRAVIDDTRDQFHFLPYAPMVLISALRGDGVADLMATIDKVAAQFHRRVSTAELNRFFADVCETHPPPIHRGRSVRINYITQGGVAPPTFILWANTPKGLSPSYQRFVKNQLRARYGFDGTPLRLFIKAKVRRPSRRRR